MLVLAGPNTAESIPISKSSADELLVPIVDAKLVIVIAEQDDEAEDNDDDDDDDNDDDKDDDDELRREGPVAAQGDPTQRGGVTDSDADGGRPEEEVDGIGDEEEVKGVEPDVVALTKALPNSPAGFKCAEARPGLRCTDSHILKNVCFLSKL